MTAGPSPSPAVCNCLRCLAVPACMAPACDAADLQLLLAAVCTRLQRGASAAPPGDALAQEVLECVQALHSLQALLAPARQAGPGCTSA